MCSWARVRAGQVLSNLASGDPQTRAHKVIDALLGDMLTEPPPEPVAPEMPSMPEEAAVDAEMAAAVCGEYYSAEVDCVCAFPTPSLSPLGLRCPRLLISRCGHQTRWRWTARAPTTG